MRFQLFKTVKLCLAALIFIALFVYLFILSPSKSQWYPRYLMKVQARGGNYIQIHGEQTLHSTLILLWTEWFGLYDWGVDINTVLNSCDYTCRITYKKRLLNDSGAILFHFRDMPKRHRARFMPKFRKPNQVWILQSSEPTTKMTMDFSSYNNVFNWTGTYRRSSDVYMPYVRARKTRGAKDKHGEHFVLENVAATKSKGIIWVASNCRDHARRQMLVREIRKYIPVDTFGECGDQHLNRGNEEFIAKYKFILSFENAYCTDYVTEKFGQALARRQIPIVSGGANYSHVSPPNSHINVLDFESIKELTDYIRVLSNNDTAYNQYFRWMKDFEVVSDNYMVQGLCDICRKLHGGRVRAQVYSDLYGYFKDDICPHYSDFRQTYRSVQGWLIHFGYV